MKVMAYMKADMNSFAFAVFLNPIQLVVPSFSFKKIRYPREKNAISKICMSVISILKLGSKMCTINIKT